MNIQTRTARLFTAMTLTTSLALTGVALSGCTVEISDGPEPASQGDGVQGSQPPAESHDEGTVSAPHPDVSDDPTVSESPYGSEHPVENPDRETPTGGGHLALTREELLADVRTQLTCSEGIIEIDEPNTRVEIVDDCEQVIVTGNISKIVAQHIGTLTIDAASADIIVVSVDDVEVSENGDITLVAWETGTPTVDNNSVGSTIMPLSELNR